MRVVSQNFVAAGKPYYIKANAGILYLDITDGKRYRQTTIPYGQNWVEIQNEQIFVPGTGNGTVTSVSVGVPAVVNPALSVSGNPVTTSGTIQLSFNGNGTQVVLGDGTLAPLPSGTVSSVGLTVPTPVNPAFSVGGSPVTGAGTLSITANGATTDYIRGDGSLAAFPTVSTTVTGRVGDIEVTSPVAGTYQVQNVVLPFLLMGC